MHVPLKVAGNIVNERSTLTVLNGSEDLEAGDDELDVMFLVMSDNYNEENERTFVLDFFFPGAENDNGDAVTTDVITGLSPYYNVLKNPVNGTITDQEGGTGKEYKLVFYRQSAAEYGSMRGSFYFSQIPSDSYPSLPSQTTPIPFVLANVNGTTAQDQPLIFDTMLRNNRRAKNGEIVAYDRFTWTVDQDKTQILDGTDNTPWVFVPVESLTSSLNNGEDIPYYLTTKLTNRSGVRYANSPYDYPTVYPKYWEFDLPKTTDNSDLPDKFYLKELSHAAPGLRTVYTSTINMNDYAPEIMTLFPVDPPTPHNPARLRLRYRSIYGYPIGEVEGITNSSTTPVPYRVTAFTPRAVSSNFYDEVASVMRTHGSSTYKTINVPETPGFLTAGDVTADYISRGVYRSFAISKTIPGSYRQTGQEAMLPVVVSFNIPANELPNWNEMLGHWHREQGLSTVKNLFKNTYTVGLLSSNNGNNTNMFLDLRKRLENELGQNWDRYIKVFLDEDREVMTISFIILLLDGTSDGVNPTTGIVTDETSSELTQINNFIAIRDGLENNKWEMTFFIAPANYTTSSNHQVNSNDVKSNDTPSSGGGGGGCNLGLIGSLAALLIFSASYSFRKGR